MLQLIAFCLIACAGHSSPEPTKVLFLPQQAETISLFPTTTEEITRIYFIHNAESEYSAKDGMETKFTSGRSPEVPLSERGQKQAARLGNLLSSRIEEAVVFIPPAVRTKATAMPLLSERIVFGGFCEGLFEVGMGAWEGKPKDQAYISAYQPWKELSAFDKYKTAKVYQGESYEAAATRAVKSLEQILEQNPGKTLFIITGENLLNALAIRWMKPALSNEPSSSIPMLPMEKGDFFRVEVPHGQSIDKAIIKALYRI